MSSEGGRVLRGLEVSDDYVFKYMKSHENKTLEYFISYSYYYILDAIMDKEYVLMDIGTGTGGALLGLRKIKELIAIDGSQKMLNAAKKMLAQAKFEKVFIHKLYDLNFSLDEKVDAIHLGAYGEYLPFDKKILEHTFSFLKRGGILVLSLRIPDTLYKKLGVLGKMLMFKRPITQYEIIFEKFILPRPAEVLLKVYKFPERRNDPEKRVVYFIKKR